VYDAAYLDLASCLGALLATTDTDLIEAAPRAGVTLLTAI
jgi:predicted nucleic acid-binding protein